MKTKTVVTFLLVGLMVALSADITEKSKAETPADLAYRDPDLAPDVRAQTVVRQMTLEEKKRLVVGHQKFFIAPMERFGLRAIYLTDASAGMHIRGDLFAMEKSIAYPSTVALAATWEPELARKYGAAIGAECRAWGADVLLGPGVNLYRNSECGRNFEYMGEDPLLVGKMATAHVQGVQSQGIMATAKHFIANNHEWQRHATDVRIGERPLNELYGRAWYRMIDEGGLGAVMTAYNLVNGEKASQSKALIEDFLRDEIGFDGLVMSDWNGVWDMHKAIYSGLDLIMPHGEMIDPRGEEVAFEEALNRMCANILTACFRFGYYDREAKDPSFMADYPAFEQVALKTARRSITLLKNEERTLPLEQSSLRNVLVTGPAALATPHAGKGSGAVEGYDHTHIFSELQRVLGESRVAFIESPTDKQLKAADAVVVCANTNDSEGFDRPFALDPEQEALIQRTVRQQARSIVVLISGGGVRMTDWQEQAGAIVDAYYAGQYGGRAIAEVLTGSVNPSGKLPFTIEREFADSPAAHDRPEGVLRHNGGSDPRPAIPVDYAEGILIGYRWYEKQQIEPAFPFGHGLSYTSFEYRDPEIAQEAGNIEVTLTVTNTGDREGAEIVQIYYSDPVASVERPVKELCGFAKVDLAPEDSRRITVEVPLGNLAFYDTSKRFWKVEAGDYILSIGASSSDIRETLPLAIEADIWFERPI